MLIIKVAWMTRILIYRSGCRLCLEYLRFIDFLNLRLPINKRIKLIDAFELENFGFLPHPVMKKLEQEKFEAYPYLFFEGVEVIGGANAEQLKIFLESACKGEFIL